MTGRSDTPPPSHGRPAQSGNAAGRAGKAADIDAQVRLVGSVLPPPRHACVFFRNADEEDRVLLPFVTDGIAAGDKALQVVGADLVAARWQRFADAGIDVIAAKRAGSIEMLAWGDTPLHDGNVDPPAMLALVGQALANGRQLGFGRTRMWGNMEWNFTDVTGLRNLAEFESRLNTILSTCDDAVICAYDVREFSAAAVMDILRTHPYVVIGTLLHENPFYLPPAQFLAELRGRDPPGA